jgi:hypothetical protein
MPQTNFIVADASALAAALAEIDADAPQSPQYTITLSAAISLDSASLDLDTGANVEFAGPFALFITAFAVTGAVTLNLNFTGTITLDGGSVDNVAGYYAGQILGTASDGGDSAVNDGTIAFDGTTGVVGLDTGTVLNGWDGTTAAFISGTEVGVEIDTAGTVENAGTITASDSSLGIGVKLGAGTVDNGTTVYTDALISGGDYGIMISGAGVVANDGTVSSDGEAGVYLGSGTVDNGTDADTSAEIDGGSGIGVWIGADTGFVNNFGTITALGGAGVYLQAGGTLTNGSSADTDATIIGFDGVLAGQTASAFAATVYNYATIVADGDDTTGLVIGVFLANGGSVENIGTASRISAVDWGALVTGGAGFVQNAGSIVALGYSGFGVDLVAGGTVVNGLAPGAAATIQGSYDGIRISAVGADAGALVDNEGTITGGVGVDFESGPIPAAGTVFNDGLITGTMGYAVVFGVGDERLVLGAGGVFAGNVLGYESASPKASTTLEFAGGTSGTFSWLDDDSGTVSDVVDGAPNSFDFSAFGTIVVDAGASWTLLTSATSTQLIQFRLGDTPAVLGLAAPASGMPGAVQATIGGFGLGGTIDLLNVANAAITGFSYTGTTLDVLGNGGTLTALDLPGPFTGGDFMHRADAATGSFITTSVVACFAAGTAIRTMRGEVCVEDLRIGDRVVCARGGVRPVVWIGHRRVDIARHPSPELVMPVRIRRGALADGVPCRDLFLSPDHAVFVDDMLVPVRRLINGASIARTARDAITYFHIELDQHDVLLAEGLAAESYLDTGNRHAFANAGAPVALHPGFDREQSADACAPLAIQADRVEPLWHRFAARAVAAGHDVFAPATTTDPALRLMIDGREVRPAAILGGRYVFVLPSRAVALRIASRAGSPSELHPWLDDRRKLGVAVERIVLRHRGGRAEMPVDHPTLTVGWHAVERDGDRHWRWTDGSALLSMPFAATMIELHLAGNRFYPAKDADERITAWCRLSHQRLA